MKAWKRIHITKKRAACGVLGLLLLAAAYMGVPRAAEKVFAVAEGERRLPIYCVQTEKPQVSVSFDAACASCCLRKYGMYSPVYMGSRNVLRLDSLFLQVLTVNA